MKLVGHYCVALTSISITSFLINKRSLMQKMVTLMRIILGCDPLLQPLTGIGNYTKQLSLNLLKSIEVEELFLFAHGKFFPEINLLGPDIALNKTVSKKGNFLQRLRKSLAASPSAVKCYQSVMPTINRIALRDYSDCIYHSPNFVLPPFDGKKVVTVHDLSTIKYPNFHPIARVNFVNNALETVSKDADHIITVSDVVKREIIDTLGVNEDRVSAVPLGASMHFKVRTERETKALLKSYNLEYKKFFLFVSTLEPRKNLENLLDAFEAFKERTNSPIPFVLVGGNGWNNSAIEKRINKLSSKRWVKHLGYLPQTEIHLLYSSAKALLFPSVYEGFGLPVLEAMQSGTPVLTSRKTSMDEITNGSAVLVEHDDVDDITDGITRLAIDDVLCQQLTESGLIRAKEFSWQNCTQQTIDLYSRLKKI
ncbi:glycosyltransferase family 4 protein [Catenovulum sp. SM1970]|uniref:glycosyltransferase family 4 protein n=1 Tax=Marinifaba aquimaris TaxID=2741323 RepID=UPI001573C9D7|nr:glycosyltransferase family 1 protein [Marinifaba aquimaris]NTS76924.1 glycosyltransferase family 4 protein [Marinifaba aquimaris]